MRKIKRNHLKERGGVKLIQGNSTVPSLFMLAAEPLQGPVKGSLAFLLAKLLFFWTHRGMGWTSAEPENSSDHWTNVPQSCALQAPCMWPPEPCQVKSRTPECCQHTCRPSRLLSCPFSGWISGFYDRGRKIQTHRFIITVTNLKFSESAGMTAAMWGST